MIHILHIENIKCIGCANSIRYGLTKISSVQDVQLDIEHGIINIDANENVSMEPMLEKLRSKGYPETGKGSALATATSYVSCMIGRVRSKEVHA